MWKQNPKPTEFHCDQLVNKFLPEVMGQFIGIMMPVYLILQVDLLLIPQACDLFRLQKFNEALKAQRFVRQLGEPTSRTPNKTRIMPFNPGPDVVLHCCAPKPREQPSWRGFQVRTRLTIHRHLGKMCLLREIHTNLRYFWNLESLWMKCCRQFVSRIWTPRRQLTLVEHEVG